MTEPVQQLPDTVFLTPEQLTMIAASANILHGEKIHVTTDEALKQAVSRPIALIQSGDVQPHSYFEIAAHYAAAIEEIPLYDRGNIRMGIAAALLFLACNDIRFTGKSEDLVAIAEAEVTVDEFAEFLKKNSHREGVPG